jgi:hypothetical protein
LKESLERKALKEKRVSSESLRPTKHPPPFYAFQFFQEIGYKNGLLTKKLQPYCAVGSLWIFARAGSRCPSRRKKLTPPNRPHR